MIVEETLLADFREKDGLLRLIPQLSRGRFYYTDYSKLVLETERRPKYEHFLQNKPFRASYTWDYFDEFNSQSNEISSIALFAFVDVVPILPVTREWVSLQHQGGGHSCKAINIIGSILKPKEHIQIAFNTIAKENFAACGGWLEGPETDLATTARYISNLEKLGLTCQSGALERFCESVYPFDATDENLRNCFEDVENLFYLTTDEHARPIIIFLSSNSD